MFIRDRTRTSSVTFGENSLVTSSCEPEVTMAEGLSAVNYRTRQIVYWLREIVTNAQHVFLKEHKCDEDKKMSVTWIF